jgi:hypothetical protein
MSGIQRFTRQLGSTRESVFFIRQKPKSMRPTQASYAETVMVVSFGCSPTLFDVCYSSRCCIPNTCFRIEYVDRQIKERRTLNVGFLIFLYS